MTQDEQPADPLRSVLAECDRLREENARLRRALLEHSIPVPAISESNLHPTREAAERRDPKTVADQIKERVALFRALFRGREDVYAVRWEASDGRSGYMPKSDRDWKAYNASKPEDRKKTDRKTRKLWPLTDQAVEDHLRGRQTIGIYPLLPDETCWFLAVDFDKTTWQQDALAFLETCRELDVPAALERSRSGNGGHVWIFFDRAVPATTARKLGCLILTRTMERRHQIGLDSYDRFFPNQDTMPKGGLGNLIALPLQMIPRKSGNSVFVDSEFRPYPDQWRFLTEMRRTQAAAAEVLIAEAQTNGELIGVRISLTDDEDAQDPWTLPPSRRRLDRPIEGPLPERVQVVRANLLYVEKKGLPSAMLNRLLRLAAFQNPEFYKAQAMRLSTFGKPRVIACGEDLADHVALPRGCMADLKALLQAHSIKPEIRDERFAGTGIEAEFRGQLRPAQQEAVSKVIRSRRRHSLRPHGVRKNSGGCMANRGAKGEYVDPGSSAAALGSVARAAKDVSGPANKRAGADRWRKDRPNRYRGHRGDPEPTSQRRSERFRRRVRAGHRR